MPSKRKPRQIRFKGVQAVQSRTGVWQFRARRRVNQRAIYGQLRDTQEEAARDYILMGKPGDVSDLPVPKTLGEALKAVIASAASRGVAQSTLNRYYQSGTRAILRYLRPETQMRKIRSADVIWFITEVLADGKSPNTLIETYLPILAQAFELSRVSSPVADAKSAVQLKKVPRKKERMDYGEALQMG